MRYSSYNIDYLIYKRVYLLSRVINRALYRVSILPPIPLIDMGPGPKPKGQGPMELQVPQAPPQQLIGPSSLVPGPYPSWLKGNM